MRHADVAYFDASGKPLPPDSVGLTPEGARQAAAARDLLSAVSFDRAITSGLRRTLETAHIVLEGRDAPELEAWIELQEIRGGRLRDIPDEELEEAFLGAFRGAVPLERRFLGGETFASLVDRVLPAFNRLLNDTSWDTALLVLHGGVNRAILSYALTGKRLFFGGIEQAAACINILDVGEDLVIRAVNIKPYDLLHSSGRNTTMEAYYAQYRKYRKR